MPTLRDKYPIRYRKILKKSTVPALKSLLVCVPLALGYFFLIDIVGQDWSSEKKDMAIYFCFVVVGCVVLFVPFIQFLYFLTYFYDSDEKNVIIRKGILAKREVTLPFSKITDVYVERDFLDVLLGLYDIHISTPTAESGKMAHIDGVDRRCSQALREYFLEMVNSYKEQPKAQEAQ